MATATAAAKKALVLPDILPDIYSAENALSAVKNHINTLEKEASGDNNRNINLLANAFKNYYKLIDSKKIYTLFRSSFNKIHQLTVKNHPKFFIQTSARTKGLLSFYDKCRIKLYNNESLDTIKDIYAFRTVVDSKSRLVNKDSDELIKLCYCIMDETINSMIALGFTPCEKEDEKNTENFDPNKFPSVNVPKKSYLSKENQKFVKDYILYPKKNNGYQSLHVVFKDTAGNYFEYQVRTYLMDFHANYGGASHEKYKKNKPENKNIPQLAINREQIRIPGYIFINGTLSDDAGIEKSVPILQRTNR